MNDPHFSAHQREKSEPDEENRPLPWYFLMLISALLMWGAFYIVSTYTPTETPFGDERSMDALRPRQQQKADAIDGKQIYMAKCVGCHQATGLGVTGVFPPLADSEWVLGSPEVLSQILLHGITGEITVKGKNYKGAMPAFNQLSDGEIAAVLSYIRSDWKNAAPPIKADTVKQEREQSSSRTIPYGGEAELKTLPSFKP
jgi:mono/diheme cytochrome c family protein